MKYNLIGSTKCFDDKSKIHISKELRNISPMCRPFIGFNYEIITESYKVYEIEDLQLTKEEILTKSNICKACLKTLKSTDSFGNLKPIQLEIEEWWFNGQLIQYQNHPMLPKYITRECNELAYVVPHSTFKDAVNYCLDNPVLNPDITPKDFGY